MRCCCLLTAAAAAVRQTMLRIRDPQASLDFYTRVLGEPARRCLGAAAAGSSGSLVHSTPPRARDHAPRPAGMTLLAKLDFPAMSFSLLFLGFEDPADIPDDPAERVRRGTN